MTHKEREPQPVAAETTARPAVPIQQPALQPVQQPQKPSIGQVFSKADDIINGGRTVVGYVADVVLPPNASRFERRAHEFDRTLQPFASQYPEETRIAAGLVRQSASLAREADAAEARGDAGRAQELRDSARSHYLEGMMKAHSVPAIARRVEELERVGAPGEYVVAQKAAFNDYGLPSWQRAAAISEYSKFRVRNDAAFDAGVPEGPMAAEVARLGDGARRGLAFTEADYGRAMAAFEQLSEPVARFAESLQAGAAALAQMIAAYGFISTDFKKAMEKLDEDLKNLLKKIREGDAGKDDVEKAKAAAEFAGEAEKSVAGAAETDLPAVGKMLTRGANALQKGDAASARIQLEIAQAYAKSAPEKKELLERVSRWLSEGKLDARDAGGLLRREADLRKLDSIVLGGRRQYGAEVAEIRSMDKQAAGLMKKADELREKARLEKSPAKRKELESQATEMESKAKQLLRLADAKAKGLVEIAKFEKDLRESGAPEPVISAVRAAYRFYGTASKWRADVTLAAAKFFLEHKDVLKSPQAAPILGALVKFLGIISGPKKDSEIGGRGKAEEYLKKELEPKAYLVESRLMLNALEKAGAPKLLVDGLRAATKFFGTRDDWRGKTVLHAAKFFMANRERLSGPQGRGPLGGLLNFVAAVVNGRISEADAPGKLEAISRDTSKVPMPAPVPVPARAPAPAPAKMPGAPAVAPGVEPEAAAAPAAAPAVPVAKPSKAAEAMGAPAAIMPRAKAQERAGILKGLRSGLAAFIEKESAGGAGETWTNALSGFLGLVEETERKLEDPGAEVSEGAWQRISECATYIRGVSGTISGMTAGNEAQRRERNDVSTLFGYAVKAMQEEGRSEKTLTLDFIAREYYSTEDPAYRARLLELGAGISDGTIQLAQAKSEIAGRLAGEGGAAEAALRAADPQSADMFASFMPKGLAEHPEGIALEALGKARAALDFANVIIGKVLPAIKKEPALREPALGIVMRGLAELGLGFADAAMEQASLAAAYADAKNRKERGAIGTLSAKVDMGVNVSRVHALHAPAEGGPGMSIEDAAKMVAGEGGDAAALVAAYGIQRAGVLGDVRAKRNDAFAQLGIPPDKREGYSGMLDEVHARVGDSTDPDAIKATLLEIGGEENYRILAGLYVMEFDAVDAGILSADKRAISDTDAYFGLGEGLDALAKGKKPIPARVRDAAAKGIGEMRAAILRGEFIGEGWKSGIAVANGAVFGSGGEEGIGARLAGIKDKRQRKDAETVYAAALAELCAPGGRMEVGLAMLEAGDALAVTTDPADRTFVLSMTAELQKPDSTLQPADFTERAYIIAKKNSSLAEIEANDKIPGSDRARAKANTAAYYDMALYAHQHGRRQEAESIARAALLYSEAIVQKHGGGDTKAADATIGWVHEQLGDMSGVPAKSRRFLDSSWTPDFAVLPGEFAREVLGEPESPEAAVARSTKLRSETMTHSLALRRADTTGRLAKLKVAPDAALAEKKRLGGKATRESDAAAKDRAQAAEYQRRGERYRKKAEDAGKRAEEHERRALDFTRQSDALDLDWFDKRVEDTKAYAQRTYDQVGRLEQEAVALEAAGDLEGAEAKMREAARLEETVLAPMVGLETYASSIMEIKTPWKENGRIEARRGIDISLEVAAGHDVDETTGRTVEGPLTPERADELRARAKADVAGGIRLVSEQRAKQRRMWAGHRRIESGRKRADIETLDVQGGAWGEVEAAGAEIAKAQAAGKDVVAAMEARAEAAHAYDNGDYAKAYRLAFHARQLAQGLRYAGELADEEVRNAHAAVGKAKAAGKNMDDADGMLAKAQEAYQKGDYAAAFKWAGMARQYGEGVRKPVARPMPPAVKDPEVLPCNVSVTYVSEEEIGTLEDGSPMIERVERTRTAYERDRILRNYDRALDENDSYDFDASARFEKRAADQLTAGRVVLDVIKRDETLIGRRRAQLGAAQDGLVWVAKPDGTSVLFDPFSAEAANAAAFPAFEIMDRDGEIVAYDPNRRTFGRDSYLVELFRAGDRIEAGDAGAMADVRATESRYNTDFDLENIWIDIGAPRLKAFRLRARAKPFAKGGLHITDPKQRKEIGEGEARMNDARADTLAAQPGAQWLAKSMGQVADRYEDAANDAQTAWLAYGDNAEHMRAREEYGEGLLALVEPDLSPEVAGLISGMGAADAIEWLAQNDPGVLIAALDSAESAGYESTETAGRLDFGDYSLRAWAYDLKSRAKSTETGWVEDHADTFWAPTELALYNGYQEFAHNDMLRASSLGKWRRTGAGVSKMEIGRTGAGWYALANAIAKDPMEFIRARDGTETLKLEPTRVAYTNGDQWTTVGDYEGGYVILPLLIAGLSYESAKHEAIVTLGGTSLLEGSSVDYVHIFTEEGTGADEIRFIGEGRRGGIEEGGWGVEERAFFRAYQATRDSAFAVFGIRMYEGKERDAIARKRFEDWYGNVASKRYERILKGDSSEEFFAVYNEVVEKYNALPKPAFEEWFARYSSGNPDRVKGRDYRDIIRLGNETLIPIRYKGQIPRVREEVELGAGADFKSGFGYMEGPGEAPIAVAIEMDADAREAARALAEGVRVDKDFLLGEALGIEAYRKSYWTSAKNWAVDTAKDIVRPAGAPGPEREEVATSETMFGAAETLFNSHADTARHLARGKIDAGGVYGHLEQSRKTTAPGGYLAREAAKGREQRGVLGVVNFVEDLGIGLIMPATFAASGVEGFFDQVDASGGYSYIGTRRDEKAFWKGIGLDERWARYFVYGEAWANAGIAVFGGVTGPLGKAGGFSRTGSRIMGWGMFGAGTALGVAQSGRLLDWEALERGEFGLAAGVTAWDFGVAAANIAMGPAQELALPHILRGFGVGRPAHNWMSSEAAIRRELRPSLGRRMLFWVGGIHGEDGIAAEAERNRARVELQGYERAAFDSLEARGDARIPAAEASAMIETHTNARKRLVKKFGEEAAAGYSPDDSANPINDLAGRGRAKREEAAKAGRQPEFEPDEQAALDFVESRITAEAVARRQRPKVPAGAEDAWMAHLEEQTKTILSRADVSAGRMGEASRGSFARAAARRKRAAALRAGGDEAGAKAMETEAAALARQGKLFAEKSVGLGQAKLMTPELAPIADTAGGRYVAAMVEGPWSFKVFEGMHPEGPGGMKIYHDWKHSIKTAAREYDLAMARPFSETDAAIFGSEASGGKQAKAEYLAQVALLHDIDFGPGRIPGTKASVDRTVAWLESADGRAFVGERYGWDLSTPEGKQKYDMALALIERTEFPFNDKPMADGRSPLDKYVDFVSRIPDEGARNFILHEAPVLSEYPDKTMSTYFDSPMNAVDGVFGLNGETGINWLAGTKRFFLDTIGGEGAFKFDRDAARILGERGIEAEFREPPRINEVLGFLAKDPQFARLAEQYAGNLEMFGRIGDAASEAGALAKARGIDAPNDKQIGKAVGERAATLAAEYERYLLGARDMPKAEQELFARIGRDNAKTEIAKFVVDGYGRNAGILDDMLLAQGTDPALLRGVPDYINAAARMMDARPEEALLLAPKFAEDIIYGRNSAEFDVLLGARGVDPKSEFGIFAKKLFDAYYGRLEASAENAAFVDAGISRELTGLVDGGMPLAQAAVEVAGRMMRPTPEFVMARLGERLRERGAELTPELAMEILPSVRELQAGQITAAEFFMRLDAALGPVLPENLRMARPFPSFPDMGITLQSPEYLSYFLGISAEMLPEAFRLDTGRLPADAKVQVGFVSLDLKRQNFLNSLSTDPRYRVIGDANIYEYFTKIVRDVPKIMNERLAAEGIDAMVVSAAFGTSSDEAGFLIIARTPEARARAREMLGQAIGEQFRFEGSILDEITRGSPVRPLMEELFGERRLGMGAAFVELSVADMRAVGANPGEFVDRMRRISDSRIGDTDWVRAESGMPTERDLPGTAMHFISEQALAGDYIAENERLRQEFTGKLEGVNREIFGAGNDVVRKNDSVVVLTADLGVRTGSAQHAKLRELGMKKGKMFGMIEDGRVGLSVSNMPSQASGDEFLYIHRKAAEFAQGEFARAHGIPAGDIEVIQTGAGPDFIFRIKGRKITSEDAAELHRYYREGGQKVCGEGFEVSARGTVLLGNDISFESFRNSIRFIKDGVSYGDLSLPREGGVVPFGEIPRDYSARDMSLNRAGQVLGVYFSSDALIAQDGVLGAKLAEIGGAGFVGDFRAFLEENHIKIRSWEDLRVALSKFPGGTEILAKLDGKDFLGFMAGRYSDADLDAAKRMLPGAQEGRMQLAAGAEGEAAAGPERTGGQAPQEGAPVSGRLPAAGIPAGGAAPGMGETAPPDAPGQGSLRGGGSMFGAKAPDAAPRPQIVAADLAAKPLMLAELARGLMKEPPDERAVRTFGALGDHPARRYVEGLMRNPAFAEAAGRGDDSDVQVARGYSEAIAMSISKPPPATAPSELVNELVGGYFQFSILVTKFILGDPAAIRQVEILGDHPVRRYIDALASNSEYARGILTEYDTDVLRVYFSAMAEEVIKPPAARIPKVESASEVSSGTAAELWARAVSGDRTCAEEMARRYASMKEPASQLDSAFLRAIDDYAAATGKPRAEAALDIVNGAIAHADRNDPFVQDAARTRAARYGREVPGDEDFMYAGLVKREVDAVLGTGTVAGVKDEFIAGAQRILLDAPPEDAVFLIRDFAKTAAEIAPKIRFSQRYDYLERRASKKIFEFAAGLHVMGVETPAHLISNGKSGLLDIFPAGDIRSFTAMERIIRDIEGRVMSRIPDTARFKVQVEGTPQWVEVGRGSIAENTLGWLFDDMSLLKTREKRMEYLELFNKTFVWEHDKKALKLAQELSENPEKLVDLARGYREHDAAAIAKVESLGNHPAGFALKRLARDYDFWRSYENPAQEPAVKAEAYARDIAAAPSTNSFQSHYGRMLQDFAKGKKAAELGALTIPASKLPIIAYTFEDPTGALHREVMLGALDNDYFRKRLRTETNFAGFADFVLGMRSSLDADPESARYWLRMVDESMVFLLVDDKVKPGKPPQAVKQALKQEGSEAGRGELAAMLDSAMAQRKGEKLADSREYFLAGKMGQLLTLWKRYWGGALGPDADMAQISHSMRGRTTRADFERSFGEILVKVFDPETPLSREQSEAITGYAVEHTSIFLEYNGYRDNMKRFRETRNIAPDYNGRMEAFGEALPVLDLALAAQALGRFNEFKFSEEFHRELSGFAGNGDAVFEAWRSEVPKLVDDPAYQIFETGSFEEGFHAGIVRGATACQNPNNPHHAVAGLVGAIELPWLKQVVIKEPGNPDAAYRRWMYLVKGDDGHLILLVQPAYFDPRVLPDGAALDGRVVESLRKRYEPLGIEVRPVDNVQQAENPDARNFGYSTFSSGRSPFFYIDSNQYRYEVNGGFNGLHVRREGESIPFSPGWTDGHHIRAPTRGGWD